MRKYILLYSSWEETTLLGAGSKRNIHGFIALAIKNRQKATNVTVTFEFRRVDFMCTNLNQEKLEHVACQGCVCVYALLEGSAEGGGGMPSFVLHT